MTCAEMMAHKESGFGALTPSLMTAMVKHYLQCDQCRSIIDAHNARTPETPEESAALDRAAQTIAAKMLNNTDPEL